MPQLSIRLTDEEMEWIDRRVTTYQTRSDIIRRLIAHAARKAPAPTRVVYAGEKLATDKEMAEIFDPMLEDIRRIPDA